MQLNFAAVSTLPMAHIESSIGYRVTTPDNISVVYTGDTDYCEKRGKDCHGCRFAYM